MDGAEQRLPDAPWAARPPHALRLPSGRRLSADERPLVMGILNVTPDSFSDGGSFLGLSQAVEHARAMCEEGADVIDVGGESTRPGSDAVPAEEELRRVIPVIRELAAEAAVPISIDTQKAEVAAAALDCGAQIINDVSALRTDAAMAPLAARTGAPVILMHMLGRPKTMQRDPAYRDVVGEVIEWLRGRVQAALEAGIAEEQIVVDPGFGFGKNLGHNLELLRRLNALLSLGRMTMVGTSRKAMLGRILGTPFGERRSRFAVPGSRLAATAAQPRAFEPGTENQEPGTSVPTPVEERLHGTLATVACAVMAGCHMVRVHDVRPALEVVKVCEAVRRGLAYDGA